MCCAVLCCVALSGSVRSSQVKSSQERRCAARACVPVCVRAACVCVCVCVCRWCILGCHGHTLLPSLSVCLCLSTRGRSLLRACRLAVSPVVFLCSFVPSAVGSLGLRCCLPCCVAHHRSASAFPGKRCGCLGFLKVFRQGAPQRTQKPAQRIAGTNERKITVFTIIDCIAGMAQ